MVLAGVPDRYFGASPAPYENVSDPLPDAGRAAARMGQVPSVALATRCLTPRAVRRRTRARRDRPGSGFGRRRWRTARTPPGIRPRRRPRPFLPRPHGSVDRRQPGLTAPWGT